MLHMAHFPDQHLRGHGDPDPDNGRALCLRDHLFEHVSMYINDPNPYNEKSLELISGLAFENGYHTYKYYEANPGALEQDRAQVIADLADFGLVIRREEGVDKKREP